MEQPRFRPRRPSREILTGDSADVYFSRAEEILGKEGLDPVVVDGGLLARSRHPVRDRRGEDAARHGAERRTGRGRRGGGARRRRHVLGARDRHAHPGALPPVRPLRDGHAGDDGPGHRLGDGGAGMRRGRGAAPGHQLRRSACAPGHLRHTRLRGHRRRLHRGIHPRRRPDGRARGRPARCRTPSS